MFLLRLQVLLLKLGGFGISKMKNPFSYKVTKEKKVIIYRDHKQIKIVKGKWSLAFIADINTASEEEIQQKLAKVTGQYKHGNERNSK